MPIYKNCFKRSLRFYTVSPLDSTRCMEYVRSNRFGCDILGSIAAQLEILSSTYIRLKIKLKNAFEK